MSFVLYKAPQSTCSQKVRIGLWEKGLEFSEEKFDLFKGEQFRAIALSPETPAAMAIAMKRCGMQKTACE